MLPESDLRAVLPGLPLISEGGSWTRAIGALKEVDAILNRTGLPPLTIPTPPWTVFAVKGVFESILDLTDPQIQAELGTSFSELTGQWRVPQARYLRGESPLPPTQLLGQAAYGTGSILGMKYDSAKNSGEGFNLVVFSDRLKAGRSSFLEVFDPHDLIRQRLP